MSTDGRYIVASWMTRNDYVHGWTVYRGVMDDEERLCLRIDGTPLKGVLAIVAFPY